MTSESRSPSGWFFWLCFFAGWLVILTGVWSLIEHREATHPIYTGLLAFATNVFHDAVIAPAVCVIAYLFARFVPKRVRMQIGWALASSAVVLAVAYAPLRGFGKKADNPSVLPLDYVTATLTVLGVVWVIAAVLCLVPFVKRSENKRAPS